MIPSYLTSIGEILVPKSGIPSRFCTTTALNVSKGEGARVQAGQTLVVLTEE
jgi:hypothetical protein